MEYIYIYMYVCVCVCTHISIMFLPHHSAEPSACVNCALRAQPPYCAVINDEASLLVCNCTLTLGVSYLCNVVGMNDINDCICFIWKAYVYMCQARGPQAPPPTPHGLVPPPRCPNLSFSSVFPRGGGVGRL